MKKAILIVFVVLIAIACKNDNSKPSVILSSSTGSVKQVLLVIDDVLWKGNVGDVLRKIISEPVLGLPQPEPQFAITRIPTDAFGGMFRKNRNILYIEKRDSDTFNVAENKFSRPQKIISILGKTNQSIIAQLQKNTSKIIKEFEISDIKAVQARQKGNQRKGEVYKTFKNLGISMVIPNTYRTVDDTGDFLWLRRHLTKGRELGLLVYSKPILSAQDTLGKTIIENRNAIGKQYIEGEKEDMYMITEKAYTPYRFDAVIDGKKAYETRGKWEMKGDFMAGPFLNYTVIDKKNNRLIVAEGFVFAPAVNKRNFMFELEATIKTLKIK